MWWTRTIHGLCGSIRRIVGASGERMWWAGPCGRPSGVSLFEMYWPLWSPCSLPSPSSPDDLPATTDNLPTSAVHCRGDGLSSSLPSPGSTDNLPTSAVHCRGDGLSSPCPLPSPYPPSPPAW